MPRRAIRIGSDCTIHFRFVYSKRVGDSHRIIRVHDTASRLRYHYPDFVGVLRCVTMVVHMMHHVTTRLRLQRLTPDDQSALQSPTKGYKVEWVSALMAMCVVHTTELQVLAHSRSATHAIRLDARLYNGTTQQWYNPLLKRERGGFGVKAAAVVHGVISSLKRVGNLASTTSTDLAGRL